MISFSKLGNHGRLGNQLFQYAFLRTQSERLGVKFYCPKWIGDEIFDLKDKDIRADRLEGVSKFYEEPFAKDYDRIDLNIQDNTDITGYFESEKNFDNTKVKTWYSFKKEKIASVKEKYKNIDFSRSVGIHLRLGDKLLDYRMYVLRLDYYLKALLNMDPCDNLLVFSDDIDMAEKFFERAGLNFIFMKHNKAYEDLYLMSQCRDFICGASTFSWWGGWLNSNPYKKISFPKEGLYRTGSAYHNKDFIPNKWIKIRALRPIIDNYITICTFKFNPILFFGSLFSKIIGLLGKRIKTVFPRLYFVLKPYFPDKK